MSQLQQYTIVIEGSGRNYGAYAPDVPGCIATGINRWQTLNRMAEALRVHFEGMVEDGKDIPAAVTRPEDVLVTTVAVVMPD